MPKFELTPHDLALKEAYVLKDPSAIPVKKKGVKKSKVKTIRKRRARLTDEERKEQHRADHKKYYQQHHEEIAASRREKYIQEALERKIDVLTYYSGGDEPACVHCGYNDVRALSIDHIEGNGAEERKKKLYSMGGNTSKGFYSWLQYSGCPDGYQTLCFNCQRIKQVERHEYQRSKFPVET